MIISYWAQFKFGKPACLRGLILVMNCRDDGFTGNIKLDIIGIAVDTETTDGVTKREYVEERTWEDWALSPEGRHETGGDAEGGFKVEECYLERRDDQSLRGWGGCWWKSGETGENRIIYRPVRINLQHARKGGGLLNGIKLQLMVKYYSNCSTSRNYFLQAKKGLSEHFNSRVMADLL